MRRLVLFFALILTPLCLGPLVAEEAGRTSPMLPDRIALYDWIRPEADFVRREVMIPMRDGKRLYTVIVFRKGTKDGPMLLSRTPYNAAATTMRNRSQSITEILPIADAEFVEDGYVRVYQDVRGMDRSEGEYVMVRPLRGPLNDSKVDHSTDAYDTIEWLVKNVPESNGKVGIVGSSYIGFTALMALIDPHPALKATVPQSPMVDGWMGDDWFHNGAFRPLAFDYLLAQTAVRGGGPLPMEGQDAYESYLEAGSTRGLATRWGVDTLPAVRKMLEHPNYDSYWQLQAVDKILATRKLTVPTMLVVSQWDQEDSYGAPAVYRALESQDTNNDMLSFVIGPWRHSGVNYDGASLGPHRFEGDTALQFRTRWMKPFLDCHLKTSPLPCDTPPVITYATGRLRWETSTRWPAGTERPLYFAPNFGLSFARPQAAGADDYVSDPAKPVPMMPRPVQLDGEAWRTWLVNDQRFVDGRPDVLTYVTPVLDKPVHIKGAPRVELHAATSGRDADWVVKLIDVFPRELSSHPGMAGYQLAIGIEIFRGRFVHGFATPAPLDPGRPYAFGWTLPNVDHVFQPGHKIMIQVQSSLFPLYERNPQTWVPVVFDARPGDYARATQTIHRGGDKASAIWLPVVDD